MREARIRPAAFTAVYSAAFLCAAAVLPLSLWANAAAARPLGVAARAGGMHGPMAGRSISSNPSRAAHAPRLGTRAARIATPRPGRHTGPSKRAPSTDTRRPSTDDGPTRPRPRPHPHGGGLVVVGPDLPVGVPHRPLRRTWLTGRAEEPEWHGRRGDGTNGPVRPPTRPVILPPPPGETRFVPDEVLLDMAAHGSRATLDAMARRHRLTRLEAHEFQLTGRRLFRLRINDGRSVPSVLRSLASDRRIVFAQPNYVYALQASAEPDHPSNAEAGIPEPGSGSDADAKAPQYAALKLRLAEAHALARGDNILVAVIDSGIDGAHPDLDGVIADRFDTLGIEERAHPHGTAMAGAIAARGKLVGVAPRVRILAVRAFGSSAPGAQGTTFHILKGLDWAHAKGARIVNMSFSGPSDPALRRSLAAARQKGLTLIAAAGNGGPKSPPLFPAADPNVIAVTATDSEDRVFAQANRGTHIAVAAPGVDILVPAPDNAYQVSSGTSVAAAHVSGVAALVLERNGGLHPDVVRKILTTTAHRPRANPVQRPDYGAGLADAYEALLLAARQSQAGASPRAPSR